MSDEAVKNNEESAKVKEEAKAGENKEAEGQGMYHLYCPKCGHTWFSPTWDNYCPKWGCTGQARRL